MNVPRGTAISRAVRSMFNFNAAQTIPLEARREPTLTAATGPTPHRRAQRTYAGASFNRLNTDWVAAGTSGDAELRTSLRTLRNRSRALVRDNEYALNGVRIIRNNVVGQGVRFQAQVMTRNGKKLDDKVNPKIEAAWLRWCKKKSCHTGGTLSFAEMQRLMLASIVESGEVLVRKVRGKAFGKSPVPFALELIEADQLVDDYSGRTNDGNEIRMGVEVDQWQRPVAYWLYPKHPGDYSFSPGSMEPSRLQRVLAEDIIHLYVPTRVGATRGVPWYHATLKRMHNMGGLEEAEIVKARAQACVMGFIEQTDPEDPTADETDTDGTEDDETVTNFEPGTIEKLQSGEKFTGFNPSSPNPNLDPFLKLMLRGTAASIGAAYSSLTGDYVGATYSSGRLALLDTRDNWRVLQSWFIEHFMQEVYEEWLDMAVLSGTLAFPDYELNQDRYLATRWAPRGWDWIDPSKDVPMAKEAIRGGLATRQSILASKGDDPEDMDDQRRRELDYSADKDLVYDTDPSLILSKSETVPLAPIEDTDKDPDAEGGEDDANAEEKDSAAGDSKPADKRRRSAKQKQIKALLARAFSLMQEAA